VQLQLTLSVATAADDVVAEGLVVNAGTQPVTLDLVELNSASLALEIADAIGAPVRMVPPPTPGRPEAIVLQPGERRTTVFRAFMPPGAPRGRYRVRFRYRDARSEWSEFETRP
jgi:hypothetical protein